jgi:SRSO17 transposase
MAQDCSCSSEVSVAQQAASLVDQVTTVLRWHFRRLEAHQHATDYLRGLVAEVERKNGWQLAEHAGYTHPRGMQRVLARYGWDADAVRDDLCRWVIAELGDPTGVLVVDETGFPKQGTHSVGVARQYCSTLGKLANCQIGVFLGYASPKGHVGIDRALFVPQAWASDPARCRKAGIPEPVIHRTKPELALLMLERALDAGVPAAWVRGDEVYGSDSKLRRALEARGQAYVLAVRGNEKPSTWPPYGPPGQVAVASSTTAVPADAWTQLSGGDGAQGPRLYDWAYLPLRPALRDGWVHAVLLRRHPVRSDEVAYYLTYAPLGTPLEEIVHAAGTRWTIEETVKLAKGQVGLDHYEVRSWQGWHRHITLARLALAALTVGAGIKGGRPAQPTSRSRFQKSAGSWSGSSGLPSAPRTTLRRGPVGVGITRRSPKPAISGAA